MITTAAHNAPPDHEFDPSQTVPSGTRRGRHEASSKAKTYRRAAAGLVFIAMVVSLLVGSWAAFTDTTSNSPDQFAAGTVTITDDDAGSAMFTVNGMKPGDSSTNCIAVTYTGSLDANVWLYGATAGTGLDAYLNVSVEAGSGGSYGNCTGFTPSSTLYSGTLAGYPDSQPAGIQDTTHSPWVTNDAVVYRVTVSLPAATPNAAQGLNATQTFTWEAQQA